MESDKLLYDLIIVQNDKEPKAEWEFLIQRFKDVLYLTSTFVY